MGHAIYIYVFVRARLIVEWSAHSCLFYFHVELSSFRAVLQRAIFVGVGCCAALEGGSTTL